MQGLSTPMAFGGYFRFQDIFCFIAWVFSPCELILDNFILALMGRIEDVIVKTMISVEFSVGTACRMFVPHKNCCFGKWVMCFLDILFLYTFVISSFAFSGRFVACNVFAVVIST